MMTDRAKRLVENARLYLTFEQERIGLSSDDKRTLTINQLRRDAVELGWSEDHAKRAAVVALEKATPA